MERVLRGGVTRRQLLAGATALAAGALACARQRPSVAATMVLRDARLFAAVDASVRDGMTVAIDGDRIVAVGRNGDVRIASSAQTIDCAGAFVMPGLIDCHTHVTLTLVRREPLFGQWLRAGLTTVRDCGTLKQGTDLIRRLARELAPTPRLLAAGPIMTVPGGYPITRGPVIGEPVALPISGPGEAAGAVDQVLRGGADFIKLAVETGRPGGGLLEDGNAPTLSLDEVRAIVDAAHVRRLKVSAHVTNLWELQRALDGGVDVIAHTPLDPIPQPLRQDMIRRGIPMVTTVNIWGPRTDAAVANAVAYARDGGVIAMGTDYPFQALEGLPHDELRLLRQGGLSPAQVLLAATRDAAKVCGLADVGTLERGKLADVIVVQGDPLRDLSALAHVSTVLQAGRRIV